MREDLPEYGAGVYQYVGKKDCGRHEIQVNTEDRSIYVQCVNTSHGEDYTFAYVWKRK